VAPVRWRRQNDGVAAGKDYAGCCGVATYAVATRCAATAFGRRSSGMELLTEPLIIAFEMSISIANVVDQ
jgi:hypothetical protein